MRVWVGEAGPWLLTLVVFAALGIATLAVMIRRSLRLEREQDRLHDMLASMRERLERLGASEARLRRILDSHPDPLVERDGQGRVLLANQAYLRLLGGADRERVPRFVQAGPATTRPDGSRAWDEAIEGADGLRWIAWIETAGEAADGPSRLRVGRDVTERVVSERALEEARGDAEAASEAKSRFLATVSHEFRTPLNGILGMSDLLLDTPLDAEQTTYVNAVRSSGEAFLSLIEEILDFSRIEAGHIALAEEPFDPRQLVEGLVELLGPRAQGKGIEIASFVSRAVPERVLGDRERLRQILVNLVGNAVKFTEAGGVGLAVEARQGGLRFSVHDTGPGIAPERHEAIFEEFEQGDGATDRQYGGTGLGLAITRRIVSRMGGGIALESTLGHGTTFHVDLPLPAAEGSPAGVGPDLAGTRVLVFAPAPFEGPFLVRRLAEAGAAAERVRTLDEALTALAVGRYDILIADRAAGEGAVRELAREADRAGIRRRIILLSPFERREFGPPDAAGFDAFLVKPVRSRSLFDRLLACKGARPMLRRRPVVPSVARQPVRVLLAEDNSVNALLAMRSLEKLGALVDWAKNGSDALAWGEEAIGGTRDYDLVLMDIRMPGLDGYEVTRQLRAREAAARCTRRLRVVALTASARPDDAAAAQNAGFDGFLAKPFTQEALAGLLPAARVAKAS
jgi:signal transduction histidine kinase/CheY-like chemotaxis protein